MQPTAALALILASAVLCRSTSVTSASPFASDNTPCCFGYISRPLPLAHVQEYFYTSSKCSTPAIVFVTRKKRQVCANPEDKWVRKYINSMEMN